MEMPETTPIMMRSIDGGIIDAVAPDAASSAVAKGLGYFRLSISGMVVAPIAAVSALAEPQTPEKNIVDKNNDKSQAAPDPPHEYQREIYNSPCDAAAPHNRPGENK